MSNQVLTKVNVAPSSNEGHYVEGAKKVINLDDATESFYVEGKSKLVTKNHTTLNQDDDCLISCQVLFNPFSQMFEKSQD